MHDETPTVYLLAGLPGSGKTTYAKALEAQGVVRLAVDEEIRARHGVLGVDYPVEAHGEHLDGVLAEINERLAGCVEAGRDVVLDHGLGQRAQRDFYKGLVEEHGGQWCLINFTVDHTEMIRRLGQRNQRDDTPTGTAGAVGYLVSTSEEPNGEGEVIAPRSRPAR